MARLDPDKFRILVRRRQVAMYYLRQMNQYEIADKLKVDQGTVSRDLAVLQKEWLAADTDRNFSQAKADELARIDHLERTYWDAWERSCQDGQTRTAKKVTGDKPRDEASKREQGRDGNPEFLRGVERCIEQRCKITGLIVKKHEHGGRGGGAIQHEHHFPDIDGLTPEELFRVYKEEIGTLAEDRY